MAQQQRHPHQNKNKRIELTKCIIRQKTLSLQDFAAQRGPHYLRLPDLVREQILSYLNPQDWLELRLVCKVTRDWVNAYFTRVPFILLNNFHPIRLNSVNLTSFLKLRWSIPFSAFHLECEETDNLKQIYKRLVRPSNGFTDWFGPSIHTLEVDVMSTCRQFVCDELKFYESLCNLRVLRINCLRNNTSCNNYLPLIPHNALGDLVSLSIGEVSSLDLHHVELIRNSPKLKILVLPKVNFCPGLPRRPARQILAGCLMHWIVDRIDNNKTEQVQILDFQGFNPILVNCPSPEDPSLEWKFVQTLVECRVKLRSVPVQFLQQIKKRQGIKRCEELAAICVHSLEGIAGLAKRLELPQLDEYHFDCRRYEMRDMFYDDYDGELINEEEEEGGGMMSWPNLRKITGVLFDVTNVWAADHIADFLIALFRSHVRAKVEEIEVNFALTWKGMLEDNEGNYHELEEEDNDDVELDIDLRPRDFVINFPNLKRLQLEFNNDWSSYNFCTLFHLLGSRTRVEELVLRTKRAICDGAFIGEDESSSIPVFIQMTNLRKFKMRIWKDEVKNDYESLPPMIADDDQFMTDAVFEKVFSRMEISDFECTGAWDAQVTGRGLLALEKGVFGQTVTKFQFELANCNVPNNVEGRDGMKLAVGSLEYLETLSRIQTLASFNRNRNKNLNVKTD